MIYLKDNIRYFRKKKGWTQLVLAEKTGILPNTISNYEHGKSTPDYDNLFSLMKVFDVSSDELLYEDLAMKSVYNGAPVVDESKTKDPIIIIRQLLQVVNELQKNDQINSNAIARQKNLIFTLRSDMKKLWKEVAIINEKISADE